MVTENREDHIRSLLRNMSAEDFMNLGAGQVAYIRMIEDSKGALYALCSADGRPLSILGSFEEAVRSSLSNKLEPVTVH
ncbi:MAG: DUF1150 family protein [Alphaproteobacteria bacterium]|nr:DUF1150 family protein [Alphaproteobacteria bacterium]